MTTETLCQHGTDLSKIVCFHCLREMQFRAQSRQLNIPITVTIRETPAEQPKESDADRAWKKHKGMTL